MNYLEDSVCDTCGGICLCMVVTNWNDEESLICYDCERNASDVAYRDEDDGQPSEYDEWQDYFDGDDGYSYCDE